MSRLLILLGLDAAVVFVGLLHRRNMWAFIIIYWFILMAKNIFDLVSGKFRR